MVLRVGEHTGLAQALSKTTPLRASASMFGIGTCPFVPPSSGYRLVASAPRSSAMINRTLGLVGPLATPPPAPPAPFPAPPAPPAAPPAAAGGLTNVTVVVAVSAPSPSERVSLIVKVPGVVLVSVALGAIGLSMTPPVVDQ